MALQKNVIIDKQSSFHRWYETQLFLSNLNWKKIFWGSYCFRNYKNLLKKAYFGLQSYLQFKPQWPSQLENADIKIRYGPVEWYKL